MERKYIPRSRGVSNLHAHLVLVTKYRYKVMTPTMLNRLTEIVKELCEKWQCHFIEGNGEGDHYHLVFRYFPQTALDKFIGNLKSVSSRKMNAEFTDHLGKRYYPKISRRTGKKTARTFWNEAYSIDSVGVTKLDVLIKYVQNQPAILLQNANIPFEAEETD
ncbi:IS200/IS605 family transposase [Pseudanabaenaceae cyanobacterium LEGE 13415]|nr:IS200/IS605 family transposase [Pseudanabaenaceae cyanobacterium LEGE 13415]